MKRRLYSILLIASVVLFSCKDYLTVEPEGFIPQEQALKTADDAITSVYGLYALMQPCVDQLFLAGDVQSDLVVNVPGCDPDIAEIAQNRVTPQNPYTDYTNFYKLVCACNNTIEGLGNISRLDPVNYSLGMYNYNMAEVVCIRAWAYLQLVKIWGDVPYIENSVKSVDEITDIAPTSGDIILAKIEKEVADKSWQQLQNAYSAPISQFKQYSVLTLLSEINLYLGNYLRSDLISRPFIPYGQGANGDRYSMTTYHETSWITMFTNAGTSSTSIIFDIKYDGSRNQKNNLTRWTSNTNGGIYAVKPSSVAIHNWDSQPFLGLTILYDNNNIPIVIGNGDYRGYKASYFVSGKDTVISKYLLKSYGVFKDPINNDPGSSNDESFPVYRDGSAYLHCAECYNQMGMRDWALLVINGAWGYHINLSLDGVRQRGRVGVRTIDPNPAKGDPYLQAEQIILDEGALESAYEGQRWFDLVRFAKRNNNPSMLADPVSKKYPAGQQAAIKAKLSNPDYWHWPYYYKNVAANKLLVQKPGY